MESINAGALFLQLSSRRPEVHISVNAAVVMLGESPSPGSLSLQLLVFLGNFERIKPCSCSPFPLYFSSNVGA
jgi:hypothetical protein